MKKLKLIALSLIIGLTVTNCFEDLDDNLIASSEINDFVWKAMNIYYLYKDNVPDLADDRFSTNEEYASYLNGFPLPEDLFQSLRFQPQTVDRFSVITSNYFDLQQQLAGTTLNNGLEFNFYLEPGSDTNVFGVIRLVLNNSVADGLNLQRGQIISGIDGTELTTANFSSLAAQTSYTLNFADYNTNGTPQTEDDTIVANGESVSLTKEAYTENPVHLVDVFNVGGETIGYLVYNGFNSNFNNQLNDAFGQLQASNVGHLVLDLRYNPGGSVNTASLLASMITGQFEGEVFSKLFYNSTLESNNTNYPFTNSFNGNTINSLNLSKVYVLTTSRSASASELVINSLRPYVEVVQIGDFTTGKTQASTLLYDSPNFGPEDINPNHTYALLPLIADSTNKNDELVPADGLEPTISLIESPSNFGTLGDLNEPLLAAAIEDITGTPGRAALQAAYPLVDVTSELSPSLIENRMFVDINESN
ncbi:MAG: peptidase S41 [Winogradskyella sp.]|nr:peptidase S41 [Winogradskyella sp.]